MKRKWTGRLAVLSFISVLAWGGTTRLEAAHVGVTFSVGAPPPVAYQPFPPAPAPNFAWQPGYWALQGGRWVWVPGQWAPPPAPGAVWVNGGWGWDGGRRGYRWRDGYWRGGRRR